MTDSTPSRRFRHSSFTLLAPGNRPAIPMIATSSKGAVAVGLFIRGSPGLQRLNTLREGHLLLVRACMYFVKQTILGLDFVQVLSKGTDRGMTEYINNGHTAAHGLF